MSFENCEEDRHGLTLSVYIHKIMTDLLVPLEHSLVQTSCLCVQNTGMPRHHFWTCHP